MIGTAARLAAASVGAVGEGAKRRVVSVAVMAGIYVFAAILAGAGFVFASMALYLALIEPFGKPLAALSVAVLLLLVALVAALLAPRLGRPAPSSPIQQTASAFSAVTDAVGSDMRRNAPYLALAAFVAGMVLARRR